MLDFWGVLIQLASCLSIFDLGGGNSNSFGMFILILGEDSHFDEHVFQMGWNHQLVIHVWTKVIWRWLQSSWTPQNRPTNRKYDHYCHPKVIPLSMCFSWEHVPLRKKKKNTHILHWIYWASQQTIWRFGDCHPNHRWMSFIFTCSKHRRHASVTWL